MTPFIDGWKSRSYWAGNIFRCLFISVLCFVGFASSDLFAQDEEELDSLVVEEPQAMHELPILAGGAIGGGYEKHSGSFSLSQNGIVCCPYDGGNGYEIDFIGRAFLQLDGSWYISPRTAFELHHAKFTKSWGPYPVRLPGGKSDFVYSEMEARIGSSQITIDCFASYHSPLGVYAIAGPGAGIVSKPTIEVTEILPSGLTFLDGSTSKTFTDQTTSVKGILFSLCVGAGALIEFADAMYLNPEALYRLPLNPISDKWKRTSVDVSIGVVIAY